MSPPPPLGPGGRPFRGWRSVALLLGVCSLALNSVILLSDRAPRLFNRASERIDAGVSRAVGAAGVAVPGADVRVPQSDFDVHVLIWAVAALLVGLAAWSWMSLLLAGGSVFLFSVVLELAQETLTNARTVQRGDVIGNALGVLCGMAAVTGFAVCWRVGTSRTALRR